VVTTAQGWSRARSDGYLFMVLVAVGLGLAGAAGAGAAGAIVFRILIRFLQGAFFGGFEGIAEVIEGGLFADPVDPLKAARELPAWRRALIPALGGLIVGPLIYFFAREARGPGVPEVMEAVALRGGVIRRRVSGLKTLVSAISIGSGGSVGREGPIAQIGASVASWAGQALRVPPRQLRTMVGCGVLFAVEIIVGDFAVAQFSPIVISSVVANFASRLFLGNHPAFEVPLYELVSPFELVPYMLVGVLTGLVAFLFIRGLSWAEDLFQATPVPEWLQASIGGLCVGAIGISLPEVFGVGYGTITQALTGQIPAFGLGLLLVAKLVATSLTIGSGGSGGIFAPSLFLGATAGGLVGTVVHQLFPDATAASGAYALVAMGAMVAATTHAPITAIILIFEMTQTIEIVPPLMAACVVSTLAIRVLHADSAYTQKLRRRGVDLEREQDPNVLKGLYVRDFVDGEPEVVPADARFDEVMDLIVQSDHSEFFVTNDSGELRGTIYLQQVRRLLHEREDLRALVVAADLTEPVLSVSEDDNLDLALQVLSRTVASEIAVVDAANPRRLVGSLHQREVISAYNQEVLRRDLVAGISNRLSIAGGGRQVDLGGPFVLTEHTAPRHFEGRTLTELDFRRRAGLQVLLIRSAGGAIRVPTADDRIAAGDRLVVAGPRDSVEAITRL
jgi:CIC family chloride channel protein